MATAHSPRHSDDVGEIARQMKARLDVSKSPDREQQRVSKKDECKDGSSARRKETAEDTHPKGTIIEEIVKLKDGKELFRQYRRCSFLGKGGFARCYSFTCLESGRLFAGKVVAKTSLTKPNAKRKLQSEIRIHRSLKHKHIVGFERCFEDKKYVYMLLELCQNHTMSNLLRRRKRLTEPEVRYYLLQILDAVDYLHKEGVIHRDLKLGNIFLDKGLEIKIGDFGLAARILAPGDRKKTICGTPNYIAPEILNGEHGHSFQVDVWSIGVIIYTLLIGRPPYESSSVKATYKRISANTYSFPDDKPVSAEAKNLIRLILQLDPESRPGMNAIRSHPFFSKSGTFVPASLPLSSLSCRPIWTDSCEREHSATTNQPSGKGANNGERASKMKDRRIPLGSRDINTARQASSGQVPSSGNRRRVKRTAATTDVEEPAPKAKVSPSSSQGGEDGSPRTREKTSGKSNSTPGSSKSSSAKKGGRIHRSLLTAQRAASVITSYLSSLESGDLPDPVLPVHAEVAGKVVPAYSVIRWVDYTSKYGLGYHCADKTTGVYFNDSSKIKLLSDRSSFMYWERHSAASDKVEGTYEKYDPSIGKKVTLLKHFQEYLESNSKRSDDGEPPQDEVYELETCENESQDTVFVNKWVKTRHAVVFCFNNRSVQAKFFDNSEILMPFTMEEISYVDKLGRQRIFPLRYKTEQKDYLKRLRYINEILIQLVNGDRK